MQTDEIPQLPYAQHFIWVFTICQSTCLPVSRMKILNMNLKFENDKEMISACRSFGSDNMQILHEENVVSSNVPIYKFRFWGF